MAWKALHHRIHHHHTDGCSIYTLALQATTAPCCCVPTATPMPCLLTSNRHISRDEKKTGDFCVGPFYSSQYVVKT